VTLLAPYVTNAGEMMQGWSVANPLADGCCQFGSAAM
jgi:hypothetical protein